MFADTMLPFTSGGDQNAGEVAPVTDARALHDELVAKGLLPAQVSLPEAGALGSFVVVDPDSNPVVIDQNR